MKNFERYEAEIKEAIEHNNAISVLAKLMNLKCGVAGLYNAINWLYEEYEPPIELTQLEYDLLKVATKHKEYSVNDRLHIYEYINILASNGYFKDVNLALTIKEVLDRAVVKDDWAIWKENEKKLL